MENVYLTKEKKVELEAELEELTTKGRTKMAQALEAAKALGDLKENAEYHQAREDQGHMEDRIREIEYLLKNAEIIRGGSHDVVEVGATVTFAKKGTTSKQTYQIIGSEGADPTEGTISSDSPMVAAMMGKKPEDFFTFKTPSGGEIEYKVISVK